MANINNSQAAKEAEAKAARKAAYNQEWAYVRGRQFLLLMLALGSMIVTFRIGDYVAALLFPSPESWFFRFIVKNGFVFMSFMGIDFVLATSLNSASNVDSKKRQTSTWVFAGMSLLFTIALSIASNSFVSSEMAGESNLTYLNQRIERAMLQDSTLKMEAFKTLENAGSEEKTRVADAKKEGEALIKAAIAAGSQKWQDDYREYKNNKRAWFWVCKTCPREYRAYRDGIQAAENKAGELLAAARGYTGSVQKTLAPTLSYSLMQDTTLQRITTNVDVLEQERHARQKLITMILLIMTIASGILSFALTKVLRDHREDHGQQIVEDNVRPIMIVLDMVSRVGTIISDIFYNIIARPFEWANKKEYILSYTLQSNNELTRKKPTGVAPDQVPYSYTPTAVEDKEGETVEPPTPIPTRGSGSTGAPTPTAPKPIIPTGKPTSAITVETTLLHGKGFVIHNGKKRDLDWVRKQLGAYKAKLRKGEGTDENNQDKINLFTAYGRAIEEMEKSAE